MSKLAKSLIVAAAAAALSAPMAAADVYRDGLPAASAGWTALPNPWIIRTVHPNPLMQISKPNPWLSRSVRPHPSGSSDAKL